MATYTSKLNLKKPLGTEHVSRSDMNDNYDKIDEAIVLDTDGEISNSLLIGTRRSATTIGSGSFAHGENITSSGENSYAAGYWTRATGHSSHVEGNLSVASGSNSHAEGGATTASGNASHAEGGGTTASGSSSHAEGVGTTAQRKSQHVSGEYNVLDATGTTDTRGTFAEIIGNGTSSSARSNARALDWDGNEYLKGDLYVGCGIDSTGGTKISDAFTGATSSVAGSVGLVPAPSAGDQTKFLCADGTWGSVAGASDMEGATASTPGVHGLVPAPAAGDQTKFLSGAGTWEPVGGASDMTGATASTAGVHGLVPAPAAGDQNKVLTGAGTWAALCLKGSLTAISGNGTTTVTLTGLTAAHRVINWGLFSDSGATTPISPTDAPADITITEGTDSYSITIANFGSAFWIQPVFILPEN